MNNIFNIHIYKPLLYFKIINYLNNYFIFEVYHFLILSRTYICHLSGTEHFYFIWLKIILSEKGTFESEEKFKEIMYNIKEFTGLKDHEFSYTKIRKPRN